jgi:hypothetical protein
VCLLNELENDAWELTALRKNPEIPLILSLWKAYIRSGGVTLTGFDALFARGASFAVWPQGLENWDRMK